MERIIAATFLCLLLATPARAGYDEGLAAANRGDMATALREWRPLAEQGYSRAQYNLGFAYYKGLGVPQDDTEAVKWYRKAAAQGHARTQFSLGFMYVTGKGVPQDYVQAHKWFNLAAAQGHKNGAKGRDMVAKEMTPAQIAEAQRLARSWRQKQHSATPAARAPNSSVIRKRIASIQRQLASLGYDPGPVDGALGPRTRNAIRVFEVREGLPVTGTISNQLEAALRSASPIIANKKSPPPRPVGSPRTGTLVSLSDFLASKGVASFERLDNQSKYYTVCRCAGVYLAMSKILSGGRNQITPFSNTAGKLMIIATLLDKKINPSESLDSAKSQVDEFTKKLFGRYADIGNENYANTGSYTQGNPILVNDMKFCGPLAALSNRLPR